MYLTLSLDNLTFLSKDFFIQGMYTGDHTQLNVMILRKAAIMPHLIFSILFI